MAWVLVGAQNVAMKFFWIALLAWDLCVSVALLRWDEHFQMHVLDIGQGDAILLTTPEQNHILVDGGPDERVLTQLGEVLPLFFREIDLLVLTHPHADHVVGLIAVLERFEVGAVLLSAPTYESEPYQAFLREVAAQGVPVYMAEAGVDFSFGDTALDVLYPFEPTTGDAIADMNDASVMMKVSEGGHSVLLTGDAQVAQEEALLARGVDLEADILKAGHHGSHTSSSFEFVEAVAPRLMVISCGQGNSYGHPHRETLDTAAALGVGVLRTDLVGRIDLVFDDGRWDFQSWVRSIFAPSWRSFSSMRS
jgi:beta-lactamase superfamily II metal-dependent hydrolase